MKHGFIKVAAATPRVTVADCKANGEEILKAIHEMEKEHVKLMVFPEFWTAPGRQDIHFSADA